MNDDTLGVSRRKLLGAMGTIGGAAALGGASTMAFFSDEEEFSNNELVAGELDLMVDWQEHYSDWSEDENDDWVSGGFLSGDPDETDTDSDGDGADDFEVTMTDGDPTAVPSGHVGLPTPMEPLIAVPSAFLDDFMINTGTEAFPDENDDGVQNNIFSRNEIKSHPDYSTEEEIEQKFRSQFANLDAGLDAEARTDSSRGDPLIDLTDVKPGDFGEVTLSMHLFTNPGFIWLTGGLRANDENGYSEPERKDDDEDRSGPDGAGELLDELRVAVWHDDGDNVLGGTNGGGETVDSPHDTSLSSTITLSRTEAVIFEGQLREFLTRVENGGILLDADPTTEERDCFPNSTTRYVCFAWWLPVDHANEIQTDRVAFDLGFYTEQCRHNSAGDGGAGGLTTRTGDGYAKQDADFSPTVNARARFGDGGTAAGEREFDVRDSSDTPLDEWGGGDGNPNYPWVSGAENEFRFTINSSNEAVLEVDVGDGSGGTAGTATVVATVPGTLDGDVGITAKDRVGTGGVSVSDVSLNGSPAGGVSAMDDSGNSTSYLIIESGSFGQGDEVTGTFTFEWTGSPCNECLAFRVDA